jgi:hypothetical protein
MICAIGLLVKKRFVDEHLREGKVYKIRKIVTFNFKFPQKSEERLAFRLEGIVPYLIDGIEYAFFQGRFKPLEDQDEDQEIDISIFLNGLRQVNEGSFPLRNEDIREFEPVT